MQMNAKEFTNYNNLEFVKFGESISGKIEGYVRMNNFFPSYLFILFRNNDENYCRIPSGDTFMFLNKDPFNTISRSSNYISDLENRIVLPFQIGFAISYYEILIDFEKNLFNNLKASLSRKDLNSFHKSIIFSYLDQEKKF